MNPGYYNYRQIESLKLVSTRGEHQFEQVKIVAGELPMASPPFPKDDYLFVNRDGVGTLVDEDATYRDYMEYSREMWNSKVA